VTRELFEAITAGATEGVRALIADQPLLASACGADGVAAVRAACYRGHAEIVEILVAAGADLDVFDAATLGRTERLGEILDARPDLIDAIATDGFAPLQLASFFGRSDAVRLLLDRGAAPAAISHNEMAVHALNAAAAGAHSDIAALLLDAGADPDATQHRGWTPLMSAAANGDDTTVDLLLAHGADATARSEDGMDAATLADERGHPVLAERLRTLSP